MTGYIMFLPMFSELNRSNLACFSCTFEF